jgi:hypothetical protein
MKKTSKNKKDPKKCKSHRTKLTIFSDEYKQFWERQIQEFEKRKEVDVQIYGNPS